MLNDDSLKAIPDSIGDLKHLRYLYLECHFSKRLPDSVCLLHNLQTLVCQGVEELPRDMRRLKRLQHLLVKGGKLPCGIGELVKLQMLDHFVVWREGEDNCARLSELKDLSQLSGKLTISDLENVNKPEEAKLASLPGKPNIKCLVLRWTCHEFEGASFMAETLVKDPNMLSNLKRSMEEDGYWSAKDDFPFEDDDCCEEITADEPSMQVLSNLKPNEEDDYLSTKDDSSFEDDDCCEEIMVEDPIIHAFKELAMRLKCSAKEQSLQVLTNLKPSHALKEFYIRYCPGYRFPNWLGSPSFTKLTKVTLVRCSTCGTLPALGQLPSLRQLKLMNIPCLECIGPEFYGMSPTLDVFPSLEYLELSYIPSLSEWWGMDKCSFPRLRRLCLNHCPSLRFSLLNTDVGFARMFDTVEYMVVYECPHVEKWCKDHANTTLAKVRNIYIKDEVLREEER